MWRYEKLLKQFITKPVLEIKVKMCLILNYIIWHILNFNYIRLQSEPQAHELQQQQHCAYGQPEEPELRGSQQLRQRRQAQQRWHHVLRKHQVPINSFQRFVMVSLCLSFLCLSHSVCLFVSLSGYQSFILFYLLVQQSHCLSIPFFYVCLSFTITISLTPFIWLS